jgi:hypothetical protein
MGDCENRNLVLRSDDCQLAYQGICGKIFNALDERERELAIYCVGTMVVHHHPLLRTADKVIVFKL